MGTLAGEVENWARAVEVQVKSWVQSRWRKLLPEHRLRLLAAPSTDLRHLILEYLNFVLGAIVQCLGQGNKWIIRTLSGCEVTIAWKKNSAEALVVTLSQLEGLP
jgi:hypothetical protein